VARRQDDLLLLAAGGLPESWKRQELPFGGSVPSAPAEARVAEKVLEHPQDTDHPSAEEERRSVLSRGQPGAPAAAAGHPQR
jgi:hypothetical protein